jgi:hypothetical protein
MIVVIVKGKSPPITPEDRKWEGLRWTFSTIYFFQFANGIKEAAFVSQLCYKPASSKAKFKISPKFRDLGLRFYAIP